MSKLKINATGDASDEFVKDLFTYIVDGGLEDLIVDTLSNKNRMVSLTHWDSHENEVTFESLEINQLSPHSTIDLPSDPISVSAGIEDENLVLSVNYSGGCKTHLFELIWDGQYLESSPLQINLNFRHSNQGDTCQMLIRKRLAYSLSDVEPCHINLHLDGHKISTIVYNP